MLSESGNLDDDGRVQWGPVTDEAPDVKAAMCDYVFGSAEEVAAVAGLSGDVTLVDGSGNTSLGGGGSGVRCAWTVDGDEERSFGMRLWSDAPEDADGFHLVNVDVGVGVGTAFYPDTFDLDRLDDTALERWLIEAGERYSGGSV